MRKRMITTLLIFTSMLGVNSFAFNTTDITISTDNLNTINKKIVGKINVFVWEDRWENRNKTMVNFLNNIIIKQNKDTYQPSITTGFIIDLNKISNISYITSLTGNIKINLDKEFEKTIAFYNYDLSSFIDFNILKYLINVVENYPDSISCQDSLHMNPVTYFYLRLQNKKIKLDYEIQQNVLLCYLKTNLDKYKFFYTLKTYSKPYRQHNISVWLGLFNNRIWRKWEQLDVWQIILDADNKETPIYVDWYVLKPNWSGEIEEPKEYGGGLCWVSTVFYQAILPLKDIKVLKRKPHSIWFKYLYGYNNIWQDANIYWVELKNWKRKLINTLKLLNNQQDLIIFTQTQTEWKKFYTSVGFYWLKPIEKQKVETIKVDKNNCAYVKRKKEIIKSCYREIK